MKYRILLLSLFLSLASFHGTTKAEAHVDEYQQVATSEQVQTGQSSSIIIAYSISTKKLFSPQSRLFPI